MTCKQKAAPVMSAINVIPMADIMLVLLIIFMVITPMLGPNIPVELAPTLNPREMKEADQDDALVVAVTRDGAIYLRAEGVTLPALKTRIAGLLSSQPSRTVFVKSDQRAKYGAVVAVVDEIRNSGAERLGLLTEKASGPPPRP